MIPGGHFCVWGAWCVVGYAMETRSGASSRGPAYFVYRQLLLYRQLDDIVAGAFVIFKPTGAGVFFFLLVCVSSVGGSLTRTVDVADVHNEKLTIRMIRVPQFRPPVVISVCGGPGVYLGMRWRPVGGLRREARRISSPKNSIASSFFVLGPRRDIEARAFAICSSRRARVFLFFSWCASAPCEGHSPELLTQMVMT